MVIGSWCSAWDSNPDSCPGKGRVHSRLCERSKAPRAGLEPAWAGFKVRLPSLQSTWGY